MDNSDKRQPQPGSEPASAPKEADNAKQPLSQAANQPPAIAKETPRTAFSKLPANSRSSFANLPANLAKERLISFAKEAKEAKDTGSFLPENIKQAGNLPTASRDSQPDKPTPRTSFNQLTPRSSFSTNNLTPRSSFKSGDSLTPLSSDDRLTPMADRLTPRHGDESSHPCPCCGLSFNVNILLCPNDGTVLRRPPAAKISLLNRYEFLSEVGCGGVGVIYKARQKTTGNIVAIKMLSFEDVGKQSKMRFQEEAKACSRLVHENLPKLLDYGLTEQGQPYMILEFFEGIDLSQVLDQAGGVSLIPALDIAEQICAGLSYAHAQGVLHRDLKPSNIMIKWDEGSPRVKIVDFGIAKLIDEDGEREKLTKTGEVIGTPTYMSPEQILGKELDNRSDLYSLGCVLYELLSGVPPLVGVNSVQTILKQLNDQPRSMKEASRGREFPQELEEIIDRLLQKQPNDRYRHAGALLDDVHAVRKQLIDREPRRVGNNKTPETPIIEKEVKPPAATESKPTTLASPLSLSRFGAKSTIDYSTFGLLFMVLVVVAGAVIYGNSVQQTNATKVITHPAPSPKPAKHAQPAHKNKPPPTISR